MRGTGIARITNDAPETRSCGELARCSGATSTWESNARYGMPASRNSRPRALPNRPYPSMATFDMAGDSTVGPGLAHPVGRAVTPSALVPSFGRGRAPTGLDARGRPLRVRLAPAFGYPGPDVGTYLPHRRMRR